MMGQAVVPDNRPGAAGRIRWWRSERGRTARWAAAVRPAPWREEARCRRPQAKSRTHRRGYSVLAVSGMTYSERARVRR
ncbi:hypothetical protein GCM10023079_14340 [Streptomyces chitinivorans]